MIVVTVRKNCKFHVFNRKVHGNGIIKKKRTGTGIKKYIPGIMPNKKRKPMFGQKTFPAGTVRN